MLFAVEAPRRGRRPLHPGGAGLTACGVVSGPGLGWHPTLRRTCPPEVAPSRRPRTRKGGACGRSHCRSAGHRPGNTGRSPSTGARGGRGRSGIFWPSLVICGRGCQPQGYAQMHRPGVPAVCERSEAMRSGAAAPGGARTERALRNRGTRRHQFPLAEAHVGAAATRPAKKRPLCSDGPSGATLCRWDAPPSNQGQHLGAMAVGRHGAHPRRHRGHAGWGVRRVTRAGVPPPSEVLRIQSASSANLQSAESYGF